MYFIGWQSLADISTDHQNMHSYSVIAHDNDIYITGGHSSSQCTVDIVSGTHQIFKGRVLTSNNYETLKCPRKILRLTSGKLRVIDPQIVSPNVMYPIEPSRM